MKTFAALTLGLAIALAPTMASAAPAQALGPAELNIARGDWWNPQPQPFNASITVYTQAAKVVVPVAKEANLHATLTAAKLTPKYYKDPRGKTLADRPLLNGEKLTILSVNYKGYKKNVKLPQPIKYTKVSWLPVNAYKTTKWGTAGTGVQTTLAKQNPSNPAAVIEVKSLKTVTKSTSIYRNIGTATTKNVPTKCSNNGTTISSKSKAWVRLIHQANCRIEPGIRAYGTYRAGPNEQDHGTATAIDIMTYSNMAQGSRLANFYKTNQKAFNIKYIIWNQKIWAPYRADEGWRKMADRGSNTANHKDHVHISTY